MFIKPNQLENIKSQYPIGTRVRLLSMSGENQMPNGLEGSVDFIDDIGSVFVKWDNGSTLALVIGEDCFEKITEPEQGVQMGGM
jgi:hypothetical protein